ncbi:O-antigen ligase domain-containing protein [Deinococcus cavernae]|uniref:O-antigen ligase domain-containing protein n=1 Tax=Deinococcus cavernae TaxID=2320857 RepID=A0A418V7A4_9DEIO|nr:O-antigen ligase domain-containing protein [Deinococcus cavernae]
MLSPLALLALPRLKSLSRKAQWALALFSLSQVLPALGSSEPLVNLVLAAIRCLLMLGLMAVGASLDSSRALVPMAAGLGIVYATALVGSVGVQSFTGLLGQRLWHPYMTSVTLGLAGAVGVWLALFVGVRAWWRWPLGLAALVTLTLSGSRGALAAALLGCGLGWATYRNRRRLSAGLFAGMALLSVVYVVGQRQDVAAVLRLTGSDTSGRDLIWNDTLSVIQSAPLTGVGMYRLGERLTPPGQPCQMWPSRSNEPSPCPDWLARLGNPWVIAHNVTLQQLAETGPLGLLGLFGMLGLAVSAAFIQRDPLTVAILTGMLLATVTDNTLLVPGPFIGELFWVTIGLVLSRLPPDPPALSWPAGLTAATTLLLLSAPITALILRQPLHQPAQVTALIAPRSVGDAAGLYDVYARVDLPAGVYRAVLRACARNCITLDVAPVELSAGVTRHATPRAVVHLSGHLQDVAQQKVELAIYPQKPGWHPGALASREWTVRRGP